MKLWTGLLGVGLLYLGGALGAKKGDQRIELQIAKHGSCAAKTRNAQLNSLIARNRFVKFVAAKKNPMKRVSPGCYRLAGKMVLKEPLATDTLQLKFTMRLESARNKPEKCVNYDPKTGCGGHGSCLYCNLCQLKDEVRKFGSSSQVAFILNGKPLRCGRTIPGKKRHRVEIRFCLPTRQEFIDQQGLSEAKWDELWSSLTGRNDKRVAAFIQVMLYDQPMNGFVKKLYETRDSADCQQAKKSRRYKDRCAAPIHEFQRKLAGYAVACHNIYGALSLSKPQPPKGRLSASQKALLQRRRDRLNG